MNSVRKCGEMAKQRIINHYSNNGILLKPLKFRTSVCVCMFISFHRKDFLTEPKKKKITDGCSGQQWCAEE